MRYWEKDIFLYINDLIYCVPCITCKHCNITISDNDRDNIHHCRKHREHRIYKKQEFFPTLVDFYNYVNFVHVLCDYEHEFDIPFYYKKAKHDLLMRGFIV